MFDEPKSLEEALELTKPTALLSTALTAWVESFDPTNRPVGELERLWTMLAEALCNRVGLLVVGFRQEMEEMRGTPKAGYPPIESINERISALQDAALSPYFLITAVRHALDQLIRSYLPEALDAWLEIADARLRADWFFTVPFKAPHVGPWTYGPGAP